MNSLSKLMILFSLMMAVASAAAAADPMADREWKGVLAKDDGEDDPQWTFRITYKLPAGYRPGEALVIRAWENDAPNTGIGPLTIGQGKRVIQDGKDTTHYTWNLSEFR